MEVRMTSIHVSDKAVPYLITPWSQQQVLCCYWQNSSNINPWNNHRSQAPTPDPCLTVTVDSSLTLIFFNWKGPLQYLQLSILSGHSRSLWCSCSLALISSLQEGQRMIMKSHVSSWLACRWPTNTVRCVMLLTIIAFTPPQCIWTIISQTESSHLKCIWKCIVCWISPHNRS